MIDHLLWPVWPVGKSGANRHCHFALLVTLNPSKVTLGRLPLLELHT